MKVPLLLVGLLSCAIQVPAEEREMALIPIAMTAMTMPGGHGSEWQTNFVAYNSSDRDIFVRYLDASCLHISPCGEGLTIDPGRAVRHFRWAQGPDAGLDYPHGVLIYFSSGDAEDLHFNLSIRDISREEESAGTELPVVRESQLRSGPIHLLNVPTGASFRTHLRIYGPDGIGGSLLVSVFDQTTNVLLVQETIALQSAPVTSLFFPDYAEIAGITESHPMLLNSDLLRVAIEPLMPKLRLWAFVSITNNETQQVTLVTPQ